MSFFVVEQDASGEALRVPVPRTFATREAALEALSTAIAAGTVAIKGEISVVDLANAVPVLLMPGMGAPAHVPASEDETAPVPDTGAAAPVGQEVYASWAEAVVGDQAGEDDDLAEALKRAASSLESEGIVAPASIDADEPLPGTGVWDAGAPSVVAEPLSAVETSGSEDGESPVPDAGMDDLSAALAGLSDEALPTQPQGEGPWPWANVTPVDEQAAAEASLEAGESRDLVAETVASLEEPQGEDLSLLTPVGEGEEAFVPRPVILGDYDEPAQVEPATATEAEPEENDEAEESLSVPPASESEADAGGEASPDVAVEQSDTAADGDAPRDTVADTIGTGYEAGDDLDLGSYTCDDCVYDNTCPKVGQATPADCGSFQWRSE